MVCVNCQADSIYNHVGERSLGMPVGIIMIELTEDQRLAHCGWLHSLVGMVNYGRGEGELDSRMHSWLSASRL